MKDWWKSHPWTVGYLCLMVSLDVTLHVYQVFW